MPNFYTTGLLSLKTLTVQSFSVGKFLVALPQHATDRDKNATVAINL
jgi:hypothetical protein